MYKAEAHNWPSAAKVLSITTSLSPAWRLRLADRTDVPDEYDPFVAYLRKLEGNNFLAPTSGPSYSSAVHGDPMDTTVGYAAVGSYPRPATPGPYYTPSAPSPITRPSREQRKQWQAQGLYRKYGRSGHFANKCPHSVVINILRLLESDSDSE